jgi:hypothetical protein
MSPNLGKAASAYMIPLPFPRLLTVSGRDRRQRSIACEQNRICNDAMFVNALGVKSGASSNAGAWTPPTIWFRKLCAAS